MCCVIVCDGDALEREQLLDYVRSCGDTLGLMMQAEGCGDWLNLAKRLSISEPDIVIVAQDGVEGLDTITSASLLKGKIIWFSNLDFGLQAYRLCVLYFSKKPITRLKVERALIRYLETKSFPG